ncbi:hypothetical protein MY04_4011 [Flammeovirga sp. MY04]|uniref:hypothetical protein n=1 Tax=Flammeovirga sp. MY04 TaxID=1191459 RepID=UPI0008062DDF|nr:hypothetical protein [Flammeovirga sp. MY04]ANQ51355.1 hypothetical protein MY04_4011 [Flammeovirga sp. MY04]
MKNKFDTSFLLSENDFLNQSDYTANKSCLVNSLESVENINDQSNGLMRLLLHSIRYEQSTEVSNSIYKYITLFGYDIPQSGNQLHRDLSLQHLRLLENIGEDSIDLAFQSRKQEPLDETSYYLRILAPFMLCDEIKDWEFYKWCALEIINYSLENGLNEITPYGCLGLSRYMITKYEDMHLAKDYAQVALSEIEKSNNKRIINNFYSDYAFIILPWLEELSVCLEMINEKFSLILKSNDNYLKGKNVKRYYQMLLFSGVNKSEALRKSHHDLENVAFDEKPIVTEILQLYQLSKMTERVNLEKVIMLIDKSPEIYEGTLLHPSLLVMKAVYINNQKESREGELRKIYDRFKYWAGYSPKLFNTWKHFVEAEWRINRDEVELAKELYSKALKESSSNKIDLKCLVALRRLAVFSEIKKEDSDLPQFYTEAKDVYKDFGDEKAFEALINRFKSA